MPKVMAKIMAFGGIDPIRHAAHAHRSCCFYSVDCSFSRKQASNKITYLNNMTLTFYVVLSVKIGNKAKDLQINCGPILWLFVLFAITSSTSKVVEKAVVPKWIHIFEMNGYRL